MSSDHDRQHLRPMQNPRLAQITMGRSEVIYLLKNFAKGGQMSEALLKACVRNAAAMLHRDRAIEALSVVDVIEDDASEQQQETQNE